jgi:hypothetical protein
MQNKIILLIALLASIQGNATTIFSNGSVVQNPNHIVTFDPIIAPNYPLQSYVEDSVKVDVDDHGSIGFSPFDPLDFRDSQFYYGNGGNNSHVSISLLNQSLIHNLDLMIGDGDGGGSTNLRWFTYLNGVNIAAGEESNIIQGSIIGFSDSIGFNELRLAASSITVHAGFGEEQTIAIDDIRLKSSELNEVPLPAGIYLFLSGLVGLGLVSGRNG